MVQDTGLIVVQDICILKITEKVIGATIIMAILNGIDIQMGAEDVHYTN